MWCKTLCYFLQFSLHNLQSYCVQFFIKILCGINTHLNNGEKGYVGNFSQKIFSSLTISFHNCFFSFLFYFPFFTSLLLLFDPTQEKKLIHWVKKFNPTIQPFSDRFSRDFNEFWDSGCDMLFFIARIRNRRYCVCVGGRKKASERGNCESIHTKQKLSQWMNEMRNNPGDSWFFADYIAMFFPRFPAVTLAYKRRACWINERKEAQKIE